MALTTRVAKAEAGLLDVLLWRQAQALAVELGGRPEDLFAESQRILRQYRPYVVTKANGEFDLRPALRAMADDEGQDYEALVAESKRVLRRLRAQERRRRQA